MRTHHHTDGSLARLDCAAGGKVSRCNLANASFTRACPVATRFAQHRVAADKFRGGLLRAAVRSVAAAHGVCIAPTHPCPTHGADGHGCTPQMRVVSKFQGVVTARGGNMGWCQKITRWSQMRTTHESGVYTLGFSARRTQGCTPMSEGWHTPVFFCASGGHHHDANIFFCM